MSSETRDTLLHGQLQKGLTYELMRAPAVSGAQTYRELCLAARNEEQRLAKLGKRRQYQKQHQISTQDSGNSAKRYSKNAGQSQHVQDNHPQHQSWKQPQTSIESHNKRCFKCHKIGHFGRVCQALKSESGGYMNRSG